MTKLNAGDRLSKIKRYLQIETQSGFADFLGKSQGMISKYMSMEILSATILRDISERLESKGINPKYLEIETEPMLISDSVKRELMYDEFIELKKWKTEQDQINRRLLEAVQDLHKAIDKLNDKI